MNSKRNILFIFLLAAVLLLVGLTACSSPARLPRLAADAVVVAFGDSITFGTGANPQESYPAVLEKLIGRRIVNAGVSGEVTANGLSRLPKILERDKPALLILCHGGNDQLRRLGDQQTVDNIRKMIRLTKQKGVAVVMIAVPSPGIFVSPASFYRDIAKELNIPLEEETLSSVLADGSLKSDYIHPNAAGYHRLAESLAALLKKGGAID
jgi:lysophospholipase L1-like esterase